MTRYIVRRLLISIPVLLAIAAATFVLIQALPGGPFSTVGLKSMPEPMRLVLEQRYGLDRPLHEQFLRYMGNLLRGDLGPMLHTPGVTVNDVVARTLPVSIQLGVLALLLGFAIGMPAGMIAAWRRNTFVDRSATFLAVLGASLPEIVLGPALILVLGLRLDWFPIAFWGAEPPYILGFLPRPTAEFWWHAVLPVLALGLGLSAGIARLLRASLLEVLSEDYTRTARAKGVREGSVLLRHALKNAMIPLATILGPLLAGVLTGTFIIEQIFALDGLGRQFVLSVGNREYFLLMSITLIYALFLVVGNLMVDIMYAWLDPRIRYD
jgi:ABC-type dipeptide/oligopeptide/nickel transport system permease component